MDDFSAGSANGRPTNVGGMAVRLCPCSQMIYAHTLLSKFELCPRQFQHLYLLKDLPREAPTQALREGREAHQAFEHRLKDRTPLPAAYARFESYCVSLDGYRPLVELAIGIDRQGRPSGFWEDRTWVRGKVDVAVLGQARSDDSPASQGNLEAPAVLLDWKTGKRREDPDELEIFGLLIFANFPLVKQVNGYYVWLKEGKVGNLHPLSDAREKFDQLKQRTDRVEQAIKAEFFPPTENPLCGWCAVKSCEFNKRRD